MEGKIKKEYKFWNKNTKELMFFLLGIFIWIGDGIFGIFIHSGRLSWGLWFLVAFLFFVGLFFILIVVAGEIASIEA